MSMQRRHVAVKRCLAMLTMAAFTGMTTEVLRAEPDTAEADSWGNRTYGSPTTVTISPDGHQVTVTFSRQTFPTLQMVDIVASSSASSVFTGNYTATGVQGATFYITSDGHVPATHVLFFRSNATPDEFRHVAEVSAVAGQAVENTIALDDPTGWEADRGLTQAKWDAAVQDVSEIGVRLVANQTTEGESYTVSDFVLFGDGFVTPPADLRPVIQQVMGTVQGLTLQWSTEAGESYTVLRASSMLGPFEPVPEAQNMLAGDSGMSEVTIPVEEGESRLFFKIRKE